MAEGSREATESEALKGYVHVPVGHVAVCIRWKETDLINFLRLKGVQVHFEDSLGVVDFQPGSHVGVIYVSEVDLIGSTSYKRKCAQLRQANKVQGVVMMELTPMTEQYYSDLLSVCGVEMGLDVIPITGLEDVAGILAQMVQAEDRPDSNMFKKSLLSGQENLREAVMTTLQTVHGLGTVNAAQLLRRFKSLYGISMASLQDLTEVVGEASGQTTWRFFHGVPK